MMVVAPDTVRRDKLAEAHGPPHSDAAAGRRRRASSRSATLTASRRDRRRPPRQRREGREARSPPCRDALAAILRDPRDLELSPWSSGGASAISSRTRPARSASPSSPSRSICASSAPPTSSPSSPTARCRSRRAPLFFETYYKTLFVGTSGTTREPVSQHAAQQLHHGDRHRRRQDRHLDHLRLRRRLLQVPVPHGGVLADLHDADAARRGAHLSDLQDRRRPATCSTPTPASPSR